VGVAARAGLDGDVVKELNLVVGAVAHLPASVDLVTGAALGRTLDDTTIEDVADGYAESVAPIEDARGSSWYRTQIIRVLVRRALETLREPM
jgi:CO/xanthine dehydrogenase FAD-binding subunit